MLEVSDCKTYFTTAQIAHYRFFGFTKIPRFRFLTEIDTAPIGISKEQVGLYRLRVTPNRRNAKTDYVIHDIGLC